MNNVIGLSDPRLTGAEWLFVATFANGGSTALAKILVSAPSAVLLHENGEAQWLVPHMTAQGQAYDPGIAIDWCAVRRIWLEEVRKKQRPCLVIEKSPPHLVRMRALLSAFSDMPMTLLRLTRDPYAVCASWAKRHSPDDLAADWGAPTRGLDLDGADYFERLGALYGHRAQLMVDLGDVTDVTVSYERLAADPQTALAPLIERLPLLADFDAKAEIAIKDYPPQRIADMNECQIARLTAGQIDAIGRGLAPYESAVNALGYEVR